MTKTVKVPLTAAQQERLARAMRAGRGQVLKITKAMTRESPNSHIVVVDSDAKKIARAQLKGVGYTIEAVPATPSMEGGFIDPVSAGVATAYIVDDRFRDQVNKASLKAASKAAKGIKKTAKKVRNFIGFGENGTHEYLEAVHGPAAMDRAYRGKPKRAPSKRLQKRDGRGLFLPHGNTSGRGLFLP